jgi:hypothetical protein
VKNNDPEVRTVTTMDLKCPSYAMMDDPVRPVKYFSTLHPGTEIGIPLLKLSQGQSIHLTC